MRGIDTLLAAFVAHDISGLPLAADARYTENGQTLEFGDGLWGTLTGFAMGADRQSPEAAEAAASRYRIDLESAATSEAIFFGATRETTTPGMLALRMKTRREQITEVEAIVVRQEVPGERGGTVTLFQPSLLARFDPAAFTETDAAFLAPARRPAGSSTSDLTAIVERYFDAVEKSESRHVTFTSNCQRRDNGMRTTGNADAPTLQPDVPAYRPFSLGCGEQIDSGFFKRISRVRERRHIAVDAARGLVLTVALFDQPGNVAEINVPGIGRVALPSGYRPEEVADPSAAAQFYVKRYEPNFRVPLTELTVQLTRVEDGRIARMETISRGAPFGMVSGWRS